MTREELEHIIRASGDITDQYEFVIVGSQSILGAVPRPDPRLRAERTVLEGEVANPANPPSGCYFHPRCRYAVERCKVEEPALRALRPEHYVKCHRAEELTLRGVETLSR